MEYVYVVPANLLIRVTPYDGLRVGVNKEHLQDAF